MLLAAGLAIGSLPAFALGIVFLGVSFALPSSGGESGGGGLLAGGLLRGGGGGDPVKAGFEDGRPVGLYFMTRFWAGTGSLEKAVWYFTEDGRVYRDLTEGFSDEALARHTGPHGTAKGDGDALVITWSDGKESRSDVERDGKAFTWDMGIFTPVEGFDGKSQLVGQWEGGESISVGGGSAATARTLDLRGDGTFGQSSAGSVSARSSESIVSGGSSGATAGTWELDDYTLTLTYADGSVVRGVSFPYNDGKSERFFFNGTMYKRIEN